MFLEETSINSCFPCPYFHKLGFLRVHLHYVPGHGHTVSAPSCCSGMLKYLETERHVA